MKNVKVVKVNKESIEFDDGSLLMSYHAQCRCEYHYLCLDCLKVEDFDGLEFDLLGDDFIKRFDGYGIGLKPTNGHTVCMPGYCKEGGFYSADLDLVIKKDGKEIKRHNTSECNDYYKM